MDIIINMAMRVLKILALILFLSDFAVAQDWAVPKFYIEDVNKEAGKGMDMYSFLEKDIDKIKSDSLATWGVFFFRVTRQGKIDSLFYKGTLKKEVTDLINKNIKLTEGHWKISKTATSVKKLWFVYPYFNMGKRNCLDFDCSAVVKVLQANITDIAEAMGTMSLYTESKNAYFIRPTKTGFGYDRE